MKKINIILLILWLIIIFGFSQDNGDVSSSKSDGVANVVINVISDIAGKNLNNSYVLNILTFIIRKVAHFTEYMILGILIINVFKDYKDIDTKILIVSILLCFIYACSDEIHQLFIIERSAKFYDVLIDTFGSCFGVFIYYLRYKKIKVFNKKKKVLLL